MKKSTLIAVIILILIIAGGYYYYLNKMQETAPEGDVNQDETADLSAQAGRQTYRNEEYGFEVKYPEDWRTAVCGIACQGFGPKNIPEDVVMGINVIDLPKSEAKEKLPVLSNKYNKVIKEDTVTMNQVNWIKLTIEQDISGDKTIFISHITELNGKTYEVGVGTDEINIVKIYNQILSTFKFIEK